MYPVNQGLSPGSFRQGYIEVVTPVHEMYGSRGYALRMTKTKRTQQGLGEAIRARVAELGTTMDRASVELGLSPNALSRWNTKIEPKPEAYDLLMEFLGVTQEQLGGLILEDRRRRYEVQQR